MIIGAFYVLMALGLSLILNLTNVINFAHGNFLALGGYLAFTLSPRWAIGARCWCRRCSPRFIGVLVERLMIRRIYNRDPVYSLLFTFGLAFVMQDRRATSGARTVCRWACPPFWRSRSPPACFSSPGIGSSWWRSSSSPWSGCSRSCATTRIGLRIRAGTLDLETVATLGVNVRNLRTFNFALGCLLAGLSGVLAAGQIGLNPNMGDDLLLPSFIAIIVGGVGSLIGTLFGGLLIGMAAALTTVFYPSASEAVIYGIMMAVLLIRPRGLMGEEGMLS